jgi:hypothetical protein
MVARAKSFCTCRAMREASTRSRVPANQRSRLGKVTAANRPSSTITTTISISVNPLRRLLGVDIGIESFAARFAIGPEGKQGKGLTVLPWHGNLVGVVPGVYGYSTIQVGAFPEVGQVAVIRFLDQPAQSCLATGGATHVQAHDVQRAFQHFELHLGGLHLAGVYLAKDARPDQARQEANDDHYDQHFQQGKAALNSARQRKMTIVVQHDLNFHLCILRANAVGCLRKPKAVQMKTMDYTFLLRATPWVRSLVCAAVWVFTGAFAQAQAPAAIAGPGALVLPVGASAKKADEFLATLRPPTSFKALLSGNDLLLDIPDIARAGRVRAKVVSTIARTDGMWLLNLHATPDTGNALFLGMQLDVSALPEATVSLLLQKTQPVLLVARAGGKYYGLYREVKVGQTASAGSNK